MNKNKLLTRNKKKAILHIEGKPDKDAQKIAVKKVMLHSKGGTSHIPVDEIMMAIAEEHKVKVLINDLKPEWFERHETLEKFLSVLPPSKFERVNKFYILNWNFVPKYFNKTKTITFNTGFSIKLKHKIKLSVFKDKI